MRGRAKAARCDVKRTSRPFPWATLFALLTFTGCGPPRPAIDFSGDRGAAGASILVDGREIGRLPTTPGDFVTEVEIADSTRACYQFDYRIPLGHHQIMAITLRGDTLRGEFESKESGGVFVKTSEGIIR